MTIKTVQANLNKGELDPTLRGRRDTELYYSGLDRARNVLLKTQGGAEKRPGTKYLYDWASNTPSILESFTFSNGTNYCLAFTNSKVSNMRMYIFKNGEIQTNINGSGNDYLDFGFIYSLTGHYFIQSANTVLLFSYLNRPVVITRTSDTAWSVSYITFTNIPQYDFDDASSPTPVDEVQQIVFTNASESDRYKFSIDGFLSEEVTYTAATSENAERMRIALQTMRNMGNSGISVAHNTGTTYDITFGGLSAGNYGLVQAIPVLTNNPAFNGVATKTTPGTSRKEDVFSATRGWPQVGCFHQGRLWVGNTSSLPDSLWGSVIADYFNFDEGAARDDESIFVTLQNDQINPITAMISSRKLHVYTSGSEFYCPNDTITPLDVRFERSSNYGATYATPVVFDGAVVFRQYDGTGLIYNNIQNQYQPIETRDLSILAPHLFKSSINKVVIQRGAGSGDANYLYSLNNTNDDNSGIACMCWMPSEGVEGFSLWQSDGSIRSIALVDNKLYLLVVRGSTTYLEMADSAYPVDCGISIPGLSTIDTSHVTGTIEVVGDGAYLGEFTSSASVALPRTVTGYAGKAFRPILRTQPLTQNLANGPTYAKKKRVRRANIEFYLSNGVTVKSFTDGVVSDVVQIPDKTLGVDVFEAPIPFTGIKRLTLHGYGLEVQVEVTQITPMPFFILTIGAEVSV